MNINFSQSDERILEDVVNSGLFEDKQAALTAALAFLKTRLEEQNDRTLSLEAWRSKFQSHLSETPQTDAVTVDDSRESIYEGRGE